MRLDRKRILITGGGSGIGLALARRLAPGSDVVIAGRDEAKLAAAASETPALRPLSLDVTSEPQAREAMRRLTDELGGLDLLVNNAGVLEGFGLLDREAERLTGSHLEVNVGGPLRITRLALPLLAESHEPALVFVSSALALAAVPGLAVYAATKGAVHSLARSLRAELGPQGVRVFEVLPPVVDTELAAGLDVPKVAPRAVADAIVDGITRDREEIRVGRVKQLAVLARVAPRLADRVARRAVTPAPNRSASRLDEERAA